MTFDTVKDRCEMIPWDGCWIWMGADTRGYGQSWHEGKRVRVHRLMYEFANGPIEDGMVVMHICDHPGCVNPGHLRVGTQSDNIRDCYSKGRGATEKPNFYGEKNHRAKLRENDIRMIRQSNLSNAELARILKVNRKTVEDVRKRKTWRHVQ